MMASPSKRKGGNKIHPLLASGIVKEKGVVGERWVCWAAIAYQDEGGSFQSWDSWKVTVLSPSPGISCIKLCGMEEIEKGPCASPT